MNFSYFCNFSTLVKLSCLEFVLKQKPEVNNPNTQMLVFLLRFVYFSLLKVSSEAIRLSKKWCGCEKFEVLSTVLLKIQVVGEVNMCRWASSSRRMKEFFLDCLTPKKKKLWPFETSGTTRPTTQCQTPDDWHPDNHSTWLFLTLLTND